MIRRRDTLPTSLEEHPNLGEILGILAQLPHVSDSDLPVMADAWHNTVYLADARARALSPDAPLVLEVLAAFEGVQALFADDLAGDADYVSVAPEVTSLALKAIRDAIAGAYARPILSRGEHFALMRAWRSAFPTQSFDEPDLGPRAEEVKGLLMALPMLSTRCHDGSAQALYDRLADAAWIGDSDLRQTARNEAWTAAVLTSRRRVWGLVRRSGTEAVGRICSVCNRPPQEMDERVLEMCLDAACALLVADAVDDTLVDVLTLPLSELIPAQRRPS